MADAEELRGEALYQALMRVKPEGLSESEFASQAGVNRGMFTDMRKKNNRPRIDTLRKLLDFAGVSLAEFEGARTPNVIEVRPADRRLPGAERRDVPILGTAQGALVKFSSDGKPVSIEKTMLEREPYGYARRTDAIMQNDKVYALYVTGESMMNRFRPGDLIYVDGRREPSVGDDVVVQLIEDGNPDDGYSADVQSVLVKTLVRRTADFVELEQYNPMAAFRVERRKMVAMHRIIPLSELLA